MKTKLLFSAVAMLAGSLLADPTPGDAITNAVNALAAQPSYSWKSTVVVPDDSPFKPGPTTGKLEKTATRMSPQACATTPSNLSARGTSRQ